MLCQFFFFFFFFFSSWSFSILVPCIMIHQERAIADNIAKTYLDIEFFFFPGTTKETLMSQEDILRNPRKGKYARTLTGLPP